MRTEDIHLRPLRPHMHAIYSPHVTIAPGQTDLLPPDARSLVDSLVARRIACPEDEIDCIDAQIVEAMFWHVLRPDEIVDRVMKLHSWTSPLTVSQATIVLAAVAEAGYPIHGNGAPEYSAHDAPPPICGEERDRIVWGAALHWAIASARHLTYVSLGDCRGFLPRHVQYDQPGSMHPSQYAALTLGPWKDRGDACGSHQYMRRHTRRLVLVRGEQADG